MFSTMQDGPLSLTTLLRHGTTVHSGAQVSTWTGTELRTETFADIGRRAAQLANGLHQLGIRGDDRVGTLMWNNNEHQEAYAAVPAMGAVLHTLNLRLFPDQLGYIVNHGNDKVILVDSSVVGLLAKQLPELSSVEHVVVVNGPADELEAPRGVNVHAYDELLAAQADSYDWVVGDERAAAAMCYTSGTTGDPKGVVYSHRSIWLHAMSVCMSDTFGFSQRDSLLAIVPMFHVLCWGLPYAAMMVGASLVMPDRYLQPEPLLQIMATAKPTFAAGVPTIWQGVLDRLRSEPQDISHLREVIVGGAKCPPAMMREYELSHRVPLLAAWGMTETSPVASVARPPDQAEGNEYWNYRHTAGRFSCGVQARIMDNDGIELPWDGQAAGELEVSGPWITGAYYSPTGADHDPEKFRDGWLRTGDIGTISPDGYLTLTDRSKDVIKSGGEWISSVDLENAVMAHPAVAEAAVIGVPDPRWDERPLVVVMLREGSQATPAELQSFLVGTIAKWQIPEQWSFVNEVPKTSVGKFDKKQLRALHAQGLLTLASLKSAGAPAEGPA